MSLIADLNGRGAQANQCPAYLGVGSNQKCLDRSKQLNVAEYIIAQYPELTGKPQYVEATHICSNELPSMGEDLPNVCMANVTFYTTDTDGDYHRMETLLTPIVNPNTNKISYSTHTEPKRMREREMNKIHRANGVPMLPEIQQAGVGVGLVLLLLGVIAYLAACELSNLTTTIPEGIIDGGGDSDRPDAADAGPDATGDAGPDAAADGGDVSRPDGGHDAADGGGDVGLDGGPDAVDGGPDAADGGPDAADGGPDGGDVGPDGGDVTPVPLSMVFCTNTRANECIDDPDDPNDPVAPDLPEGFADFVSTCIFINEGDYLLNGEVKLPELGDFLDDRNEIQVTFNGNQALPEVMGQQLTFEPLYEKSVWQDGELVTVECTEEDIALGDCDSFIPGAEGSWTARDFMGRQLATINASAWDRAITQNFYIPYSPVGRPCSAPYFNPCDSGGNVICE